MCPPAKKTASEVTELYEWHIHETVFLQVNIYENKNVIGVFLNT